jgi:hypothetical protein
LTAISEVGIENGNLTPEAYEELQKFYSQIQTHPIEFSLCGFYTINYDLLAGVKSLGTTEV